MTRFLKTLVSVVVVFLLAVIVSVSMDVFLEAFPWASWIVLAAILGIVFAIAYALFDE